MCPHAQIREVVFSSRKIRCLLVLDHVLLRQGLRRLLEDEADIDVVSEAGNAAECLRKLHEFQPDVLIADAETFDLPAREAERLVALESPKTGIVFLGMDATDISAFAGLHVVTASCAVRQTSADELVGMIRRACGMATEHATTSPGSTDRFPTNHREAPSRRDVQRSNQTHISQGRALTAREREVLKLLAEGNTVREVATVLGLSSKTVDAHKFNLMRKLGLHNKAELVMWAIQKQVLKLPANF